MSEIEPRAIEPRADASFLSAFIMIIGGALGSRGTDDDYDYLNLLLGGPSGTRRLGVDRR